MGAVKITNTTNGKILIATFPNLRNKWLTLKLQLDMGQHPNSQLQSDWKELGESSFAYEVIEDEVTDKIKDMKWELKKLKKKWLEKLSPFGNKGYHKESEIE